MINNRTYALARELAEGCGSLMYWDKSTGQATVVPATAPAWESMSVIVDANRRWRTDCQMHQARLDHIWAAALRSKVDPLLLLAILVQEGTGSFDTNPTNAAQYNGNGPDANWIADTARAISHVAGKLTWYSQAVAVGFREVAGSIGLEGTAVQFLNWPGPIWHHAPGWGCYAQHAEWWAGVTRVFEQLGGSVTLLSEYWAAGPVAVDTVRLSCQAVTDQPGLCSDETGRLARPGVVTRIQ
jgi:hypothetical protein